MSNENIPFWTSVLSWVKGDWWDLCYNWGWMCVCIPDLSGNVSTALDDMKNQVKAMSNENIPFWTSVLSWVKGDWWDLCYNWGWMCVCIPDLSGNVSTALDDMKNQVKAMSNENIPFWTSVISSVKGDWWKTILTIVVVALIVLLCGPWILQCIRYIPMNDAHNMS